VVFAARPGEAGRVTADLWVGVNTSSWAWPRRGEQIPSVRVLDPVLPAAQAQRECRTNWRSSSRTWASSCTRSLRPRHSGRHPGRAASCKVRHGVWHRRPPP